MRTLWVLALAVACATVAVRAEDDDEEWGDLLSNLDQIDKKTFTDDDDDGENEDIDEALDGEAANPCEKHVCGWGKECLVTKTGKPTCECMRACPEILKPDPFDKVCSSQNETFDSLCHLYKMRCECKRGMAGCDQDKYAKAHLEYLGECKSLEVCTDELMAQFPDRMADWLFQVMKDLKQRRALHGSKWKKMLTQATKDDTLRHVYPVIWKFCELDKQPNDKTVTQHELIPITAPVIPMESCIKPFLEKCDTDDDKHITLNEWGSCLGLQEEEIIEQC